MSESLPEDRVWNLPLALKGVDGCVSDFKELLEVFVRQAPILLSDIRNAIENKEVEKLHLAAHTLNGSLQILCADAASSLASQIEAAGRLKKTEGTLQLLSGLEAELAYVLEKANAFIEVP